MTALGELVRQSQGRVVINPHITAEEFDAVTAEQLRRLVPMIRFLLKGHERMGLDFGCGRGHFTGELAERLDLTMVGYDPCRELLDLAPPHPRVRYVSAGPHMGFDLVLCWAVLGGIPDAQLSTAFDELGVMTGPGGLLVLAEHVAPQPAELAWRFRDPGAYLRPLLVRGVALERIGTIPQLSREVAIFAGRQPISSRSREFWAPDQRFAGETVFILGGGPSLGALAAQDGGRLRGRRVIAVNAAAKAFPWAEVLFFTDHGWLEKNLDLVIDWPGEVVTVNERAKAALPDRIRRVELDGEAPLAAGLRAIRQGRSSGQTAVALAAAMGAARIVLLGFDMRLVEGRSHFHDDYREDPAVYPRSFLPGFAGWRELAQASGVEILNATPGSALTEFPAVDLEELLRC